MKLKPLFLSGLFALTSAGALLPNVGYAVDPPITDETSPLLEMAINFSEGINGYPKDDKKAFSQLKTLADKGVAAAQYEVGNAYLYGIGVKHNASEAAKWYKKAVENQYVKAYATLAKMYEDGLGVKQDYAKAAKLAKKSAEMGMPDGKYQLAWMYMHRHGVTPTSEEEIIQLLTESADEGYAPAQYYLGLLYIDGIGVSKDLKKAEAYIRLAAKAGLAEAQHKLAEMYPN